MAVSDNNAPRKCTKCGEIKATADFNRGKGPGGLRSDCKVCHRAASTAWNQRNREKYLAKLKRWAAANRGRYTYAKMTKEQKRRYQQSQRTCRLRKMYGLTREALAALIESQGGVCAVCGGPLDKLNVDHCHKTGMVRGALCAGCNRAIGMLGDDSGGVRRALDYLLRFECTA